jgi:putative holliday junction resolvase
VRRLALDVGERRIGVAVSDPTGLLASPLLVIRRGSKAEDFQRIVALVREQATVELVVGLPLASDGSLTAQARRIQRYIAALAEALKEEGLDLPILYQDERQSTASAQEAMIAAGRRARERRARMDAVAAAVILQEYLDIRRAPDTRPLEEEHS